MTASDRDQHIPIEDLSAYADDEIRDAADRERIEQHLAVCDFCRQELSELQAVSALLADLPEPELPRSFRLTEADTGLDVGTRPTPIAPWIVRHQTLFRYASVAAVFLLAVVLTVDLLPESGQDTDEVATMMDQPARESLDTDESADGPGIMSAEEGTAPDESEAAGDAELSDEDAVVEEDRDEDMPVAEDDLADDVPVEESAPATGDDRDAPEHPQASDEREAGEVEPFADTALRAEDDAQQQLTIEAADVEDEGITTLQVAAIVLAVLSVLLIMAGFILPRWWQSSAR